MARSSDSVHVKEVMQVQYMEWVCRTAEERHFLLCSPCHRQQLYPYQNNNNRDYYKEFSCFSQLSVVARKNGLIVTRCYNDSHCASYDINCDACIYNPQIRKKHEAVVLTYRQSHLVVSLINWGKLGSFSKKLLFVDLAQQRLIGFWPHKEELTERTGWLDCFISPDKTVFVISGVLLQGEREYIVLTFINEQPYVLNRITDKVLFSHLSFDPRFRHSIFVSFLAPDRNGPKFLFQYSIEQDKYSLMRMIKETPTAIKHSPDGRLVAITTENHQRHCFGVTQSLSLYSADSFDALYHFPLHSIFTHHSCFSTCQLPMFSMDGEHLAFPFGVFKQCLGGVWTDSSAGYMIIYKFWIGPVQELKAMCRTVILHATAKSKSKSRQIHVLPLPPSLLKYLNFEAEMLWYLRV